MQFKFRQQFSCGSIKAVLHLDSQRPIPNSVADQMAGSLQGAINHGIIPACSNLASSVEDDGYTTVRQSMTYTAYDHTVSIEVALTVRAANLDGHLSHILAHELVELHAAPELLNQLLDEAESPTHRNPFMSILEELAHIVDGKTEGFPGGGLFGTLADFIDSESEGFPGDIRLIDLGAPGFLTDQLQGRLQDLLRR